MLALAAIVFVAFVVEAAAGFGATVVTVTLAAQLFPVEKVLATFIPVNFLLSSYLVIRHHRGVAFGLLLRKVLPWMGSGVAVGLALFQLRAHGWLKVAFAAFVACLALFELWRGRAGAERPRRGARAALLGAGVVHGLFACGGPLAVYALGREIDDKSAFRSTLSALWLMFHVVLITSYAASGELGAATLRDSVLLIPSLVAGIVAGELVHRHVSEARFRTAVNALLLAAGTLLLVRSV